MAIKNPKNQLIFHILEEKYVQKEILRFQVLGIWLASQEGFSIKWRQVLIVKELVLPNSKQSPNVAKVFQKTFFLQNLPKKFRKNENIRTEYSLLILFYFIFSF